MEFRIVDVSAEHIRQIEEIERDQLPLAPGVEECGATAATEIGLDRRHQRGRLHRHLEIALEHLERAAFGIEAER